MTQKGKIGCDMNRLNLKRAGAFTIIELMIVVIIIAILVALAYPSYIDYVRKAKRGEAQQLLLNWAINQEIWRSNNPAYAGTGDLDFPSHEDYTFGFVGDAEPDATTYNLEAKASGDQAKDAARDGTPCATLSLNESGVKRRAPCWE
jgi:type IV pilus assembly protein PilE